MVLEHPKQGEKIQSYLEDIIAVTDPEIPDLNRPKSVHIRTSTFKCHGNWKRIMYSNRDSTCCRSPSA